jgi:hypothetical protein
MKKDGKEAPTKIGTFKCAKSLANFPYSSTDNEWKECATVTTPDGAYPKCTYDQYKTQTAAPYSCKFEPKMKGKEANPAFSTPW